ncbi:DEAD/DEAH box helicase family protein [Cryptosporidium felis]|nr:DEAD/DEAH box helicase family protein [Cryptosporidium felis]
MTKGAFQSFGFSQKLLKAIKRIGFALPTPIQRKCFPAILAGRDAVVMARTGSGKTAGFVLPMIERLGCGHSQIVGIRGVILSPTRELALQTCRVVRKLASETDVVTCALIGGSSLDRQFESLSGNPDIVIATPGRLLHHIIEAGLSLLAVKIIVLDEADRLFEMGLISQVEKILEVLPKEKQCILVSATMPTVLASFSRAKLNEPEIIQIDSDYLLSETLKLTFLLVREDEKLASLLFLLRTSIPFDERVIIFCATKHHVDFISQVLIKNNILVSYLYGNMDQEARTINLNMFRKSKTRALVVTDIAARGVDIPMVKFVINFDFPLSSKLFVHRTGRTARAGQFGRAFSLITARDLPYTMDLCLFLGLKIGVLKYSGKINTSYEKCEMKSPRIANNTGTESMKTFDDSIPISRSVDESNLVLAGFPDLSLELESIERVLLENSEIERLRRSMESAYLLYLKTRSSSSKESLKRTKELLEYSGGISNILMSVHPDLQITINNCGADTQKVSDYEPINDPLIDYLKSFRPTESRYQDNNVVSNVDKTGIGKIILKSAIKMKKIKEMNTMMKSILNIDRKGNSDKELSVKNTPIVNLNAEVPKSGIANKKRIPKKQNNRCKEAEHFFIPYKNNLEEISRSDGLQLEKYAFDIDPDEDCDIRKQKYVRKWNSVKKKYEIVDKSKQNPVKKVNESGIKVRGELKCRGQYKKWKASTNLKIQNVGEIEDANIKGWRSVKQNYINAEKEFSCYSEFSDKHKGILEALKKGIKLTHKQFRIARRIKAIKCSENKDISGTELRTPQQILKKRENDLKKRMKNDPNFRKKQLMRNEREFNEKNLKRIVQKGRPNRSKVLIVRKHS